TVIDSLIVLHSEPASALILMLLAYQRVSVADQIAPGQYDFIPFDSDGSRIDIHHCKHIRRE
ncbi:hypothetical protein, partial [Halomonas cupida]|uniref:hypothetical protein n=1 Tax=Halomonas cupida TaxID=44933 RepID=UPI001C3F8C7C